MHSEKKQRGVFVAIRVAAAVLALLLGFGASRVGASVSFPQNRVLTEADFQSELDTLNQKRKDLEQQNAALKEQIASAKSEKEKKLVEKTQWERQIQITKEEINVLGNRIEILGSQITQKTDEIEEKQADITYNFEQYKKRMRAMYMAGEASTFSMVLGASDFTDFLMRTEMVRATAEHDRNLLQSLRTDRTELELAKTSLNESKQELEDDNDRMAGKKTELEGALSATNSAIQDINMLEQEYTARKAELDAQDKQAQAQLDKIYEKIDNSTKFVGGTFGWPLPGFTTISSYYGWRFSNTNFHTGIDMAGANVFGASIRASNSGTIAYVQTSYTPGVGYGRHVIVDHGGGYTTLYAHMTSVSVKVGDTVERGTSEIGKVGSTGWSTGPHLHFEIRINGKHQNPLSLLKG